MLYLTVGVALAHLQASQPVRPMATPNVSNCAPGNYFSGTLGPAVITHSSTQLGWTAGSGIDFLLWSHWVLRAQYRFSDFGYPSSAVSVPSALRTREFVMGVLLPSSPLTVAYELPMMQHNFEFGLAYKFGQ